MGLSFSKQEPIQKIEDLTLQHHMINYISKSFCIRNLVSRQRRRMLISGFDLDMSYITDRLLAMSFPAERMRAMYRNPLWQVKFVLDVVHEEHYKIYNLCIEEKYNASHFHGRVEVYPFDDNHVPHLEMIKTFCESVYSWLSLHAKHIAVIHCMAGKGRTGLMVCSYLVYSGMPIEEAFQLYAHRRTTNNQGVSIPSQRRYVGYWGSILSFPRGAENGPPVVKLPELCSRDLRRIRLYDTVNTDSIYFAVSELQEITGQLYRPAVELTRSWCRPIKKGFQRTHSSLRYYLSFFGHDKNDDPEAEKSQIVQMDTENPTLYSKTCLECCFKKPVQVTGDVRVVFYQKMNGGRLFYTCFNTSFIKNSLLQLKVGELDKIGGKGRSICGPAFCLELLFGPANANHSFSTGRSDREDDDCSGSDLSWLGEQPRQTCHL